ncbi:dephospho-CoA kinase [Neisseria sp. HSC-16F19]|nr:dephospho-CoA kinase [Neisseria sp. HSC-16F19]MCP2040915.1 dephospho-CoA kinase [Neisseria sp. HSC-16F19]
MWVGLTGGIGSGKSAATAAFAALGVPVLDADALARALTAPQGAALPAIRTTWGDGLFNEQGELDRDALRQRVFRQPEEKEKLERILHPLIFQALQEARDNTPTPLGYGIMDIPLLIEAPQFQALVERIVVIDAEESTQIARVMARNGLTTDAVRAIMAQQAERSRRLAAADDVIRNEGSLDDLQAAVGRLHRFYQTLSAATP